MLVTVSDPGILNDHIVSEINESNVSMIPLAFGGQPAVPGSSSGVYCGGIFPYSNELVTNIGGILVSSQPGKLFFAVPNAIPLSVTTGVRLKFYKHSS